MHNVTKPRKNSSPSIILKDNISKCKLELACRKWLKNHKSAKNMVKKREHMHSAESPQVRKVNTKSQ